MVRLAVVFAVVRLAGDFLAVVRFAVAFLPVAFLVAAFLVVAFLVVAFLVVALLPWPGGGGLLGVAFWLSLFS